MNNRNELAFPSTGVPGITLRDWFAGQALAGLCSLMSEDEMRELADGLRGGRFQGQAAYVLADAMLAARAK